MGSPAEYGGGNIGREKLPVIPDPFTLTVRRIKTANGYETDPTALKQLAVIGGLLAGADEVITATDAAREGQLIAGYLYEYLGYKGATRRLWISSLTHKAITEGLDRLRPGSDYENLYLAGKARREADWKVGYNASLALGIAAGRGGYSLGRVQTPTLALICRRYLENRDFIPVTYYNLCLSIAKDGKEHVFLSVDRYRSKEEADSVWNGIKVSGTAIVKSIKKTVETEQPPLLYDLTSLQCDANNKVGFTAQHTLTIAQRLYEKGYISYPRTGSRYIGDDLFLEIPSLLSSLKSDPRFARHVESLEGKILNRHTVDDAKLTDHHALVITGNTPSGLTPDEQALYSMIAGRMLEAFSERCIRERTCIHLKCNDIDFKTERYSIREYGWRSIYTIPEKDTPSMPELKESELLPVLDCLIREGKTMPEPIFTDASLLFVMENADREVEGSMDKEAVRECGLGTPATRAGIIELLVDRQYVERRGKNLFPTSKGLEVYGIVKDKLIANVQMTARWEYNLREIEKGNMKADVFAGLIDDYARQIVSELICLKQEHPELPHCKCPKCGKETVILYGKVAKCCDTDCGFLLYRSFKGKILTDDQMLRLLQGKRTSYLKFMNRQGKVYEASLKIDDSFRICVKFKDNRPKK